MGKRKHWAIFIDNTSDKGHLIDLILNGHPPEGFIELNGRQGALFSKLALEKFIDEEERHDNKVITKDTVQDLRTMSSGERKKALLEHILKVCPDYIILDNPFDNLDIDSQAGLRQKLEHICNHISIVQLISRKTDVLPFIDTFLKLAGRDLIFPETDTQTPSSKTEPINGSIPPPLQKIDFEGEALIQLEDVNVSYFERPILKNINWKIKKGDFWELKGKNGSGKTTILSMITGENPKGYGQELYIFGRKKGSGESVWDIKKRIGYFTPAMTDKFTGYHSVENMIISGFNDSIGLYVKPTEAQLRSANSWLGLIGMRQMKNKLFHNLTMGQKRLVMCVRAMIKHPILLILDEPTAGLDDESAELFVELVNKFARESETTIIFVSHRREPNLRPDSIYELEMSSQGSVGRVLENN
ncbi:MAG: ATP-binding cassette domain-containing protein [Aurantibacter sp.]